jgi:hypothetical protein
MTSSVSSPPPEAGRAGPALDAECRAITRYLIRQDPDPYVVLRYREGHRGIPFRRTGQRDAVDGMLVLFASHGGWRARVADAYSRIFRPHGVLRQKLTLLLAILENAPVTHRQFTTGGRGMAGAIGSSALALLGFGVALSAGVILLGPGHLVLSRARPPR